MLVCNVSLRPPRRGITADIAEVGAATDATATGQIVFATLVDDPASVDDRIDAYLGEIMLEAASASSTVDGGLVYTTTVFEAVTSISTEDGTVTVTPAVLATLDGAPDQVTMSNGNRTATRTNSDFSWPGVRSTSAKSTGKYYFEVTFSTGASSAGCGILGSTAPLTDMMSSHTNCTEYDRNGGVIYSNDTSTIYALGSATSGTISVAVDLDARKGWMRRNGGLWNGDATANPATGVNAVTIEASLLFAPAVGFGGFGGVGGSDFMTLNCGQVAYAYAAPSGFGNWPG